MRYLAGRVVGGKRLPVAAGLFYEAEPDRLRAQMEWGLRHPLGPGDAGPREGVAAVMAPHGGYFYAGPLYAAAFSPLARSRWDSVVVVGPNHTGVGPGVSVYPSGSWVTPLGEVAVDEELASRIAGAAGAELDVTAHLYEHSVEVVVPWLQFLLEPGWRLVAVAMLDQEPSSAARLAHAVAEAAASLGRSVLVVASANLSSYLGYEEAVEKDKAVLERLVAGSLGAVYEAVVENQVPTCSAGVMEFLGEYARIKGCRLEVLRYATSGDVGGEKEVVTGYAAAVAQCPGAKEGGEGDGTA